MRRILTLLTCCAALVTVLPAAARPVPVQRTLNERTLPRVRAGVIPLSNPSGRLRVIADLPLPPLAAQFGRNLYAAGARRKLDVASSASRAYLRRIDEQQARIAAALRRAIPQARIGRRFRVILDALTISLPASKLPALVRQPSITRVYPSVAYTLALDRSPSIIGADVLRQTRGADGTGMKIAVVDDGIDQTNPFFNPAGFSYPAGFPKGLTDATTPKVIVARVFPGPNAGSPGQLPVDPASSFHGTHVAGADHPQVTGLSGVAPRAWLGTVKTR